MALNLIEEGFMAADKNDSKGKQMGVNLHAETTPIFYTDNVMITVNDDGVVLNVCQVFGHTNEAQVVSRVGMSRSHAKKLVKQLGDLIAITEQGLPKAKMLD